MRGFEHWEESVLLERRELLVLGCFVPASFRCPYDLTEKVGDRLL